MEEWRAQSREMRFLDCVANTSLGHGSALAAQFVQIYPETCHPASVITASLHVCSEDYASAYDNTTFLRRE